MMIFVFGLLLQNPAAPPAPAPDAWSLPEGGDDSGVFVAAQVFSGIDATVAATEPETLVPQFRLDRPSVSRGGTTWRSPRTDERAPVVCS